MFLRPCNRPSALYLRADFTLVADAALGAVGNLHYVIHQINLGLQFLPFPICALAFLGLLHIRDFGEGCSEIHFLRQREWHIVAVFI